MSRFRISPPSRGRSEAFARAFACAAAILLVADVAAAQGAKKRAPGASVATFAVSPDLGQRLRSSSDATVRGALDEIRIAGKGATAAVPAILELLERGTSTALTEAALDTLGDIESESASSVVAWYAAHRNPKLRRAAVKALIRTKGPAAVKTLRHALSDSDAMVRGVAATGLGTLKAKEAVADLFAALDHRTAESAASIGQLCAPTECDQLTAKLGKLPFDIVTSGLDQILFRSNADLADEEKLKVISAIRGLATQEANKFLKEVQSRWPKTGSAALKQVIDQAVAATNGATK
jgi:HEAT repeat protein